MLAFLIFIGAGIGGLARYSVGTAIQQAAGPAFPWGTLAVNVSGSLLLTFAYALLDGVVGAPEWRAFLGIGVLGGYTTFSTFSLETLRLLQAGDWHHALLYALGSVALSLGAALLGLRLASLVLSPG